MSARAQVPFAPEVKETPIFYSRQIPRSVSRQMRRGAKSLFWGLTSTAQTGTPIGVHISWFKQKAENSDTPGEDIETCTVVHVFARTKQTFRKINSISIWNQNFYEGGDTKFRMHLVWLNRAPRRVPILIFDAISDQKSEGRLFADTSFLFFNPGWRGRLTYQGFGFGYYEEYKDRSGFELSRDGNGNLQAVNVHENKSGTSRTKLIWDESESIFKPEQELRPLKPNQ